MSAAAEPAVAARDDPLGAHEPREALDTFRYQLRMLDQIGRMGHDTGQDHLARRQRHAFPHAILVFVPHVRGLEGIEARLHRQHHVHQIGHRQVERVRAVPAAPAEVITHAVLGHVAQRMVQRFHPGEAAGPERVESHDDADAIPERGRPRVVDLQQEPGIHDRFVLDPQRLRQSPDELLRRLVVLVAAIRLEARGRGAGEKALRRIARHRLQRADLARERVAAGVGDGAGGGGVAAHQLHAVVAGEEKRLPLGRVPIELGEGLAILPLRHDRSAGRHRTLLESPQPVIHEREPVALLGQLALVDDVEASGALLRHHPRHGVVPGRRVVLDRRVEAGRAREAPHVGRQDAHGGRDYTSGRSRLPAAFCGRIRPCANPAPAARS